MMGWCRLPVLLCFHGLFLRISSESFFAIYIYTPIYTMSAKIKKNKREKKGRKWKRKKKRVEMATWDFRDFIYAYTQIISPRLPRVRKIPNREGSVGRGPKYTTDPKLYYLYMPHTHTHRPVKAGTTWLCLSWKLRFCMEHMSTSFYYRLRTDYPSPISYPLTKRVRPRSELFLNPFRFPARSSFLFLSLWRLQSRACNTYALYIY